MYIASINHFDDLLDNCILAIQEQGKTVEDCLVLYPNQREELEPLLRLVTRLQAAHTLKAPPEFRRTSTVRVRNLVASRPRAREHASKKDNPWQARLNFLSSVFHKAPATVLISALVAVLLLTGLGTAYASAAALPGDALYPVKITIEEIRLVASPSDASDARLHIAFAHRRLREASTLLEKERPQDIERTLTAYETELKTVLALLADDSALSPAERTALADIFIAELPPKKQAKLNNMLAQVPESTRPTIEKALATSQTTLNRALELTSENPQWHTPEPTHTLTHPPTSTPTVTVNPTSTPTPTSTPSSSPKPTEQPTRKVDREPTMTPHARPTIAPTTWPTGVPTAWPTGAPTAWPTGVPTAWPTGAPTAWPTGVPTAWPTGAPTAWPTGVPTAWPTSSGNEPTPPSESWPTPPSGGSWPDG
jgi:hypothetical protein